MDLFSWPRKQKGMEEFNHADLSFLQRNEIHYCSCNSMWRLKSFPTACPGNVRFPTAMLRHRLWHTVACGWSCPAIANLNDRRMLCLPRNIRYLLKPVPPHKVLAEIWKIGNPWEGESRMAERLHFRIDKGLDSRAAHLPLYPCFHSSSYLATYFATYNHTTTSWNGQPHWNFHAMYWVTCRPLRENVVPIYGHILGNRRYHASCSCSVMWCSVVEVVS